MKKRAVLIPAAAILAAYLGLQCYILFETGKRAGSAGNDRQYDAERLQKHAPSVLTGKKILFLGSSVTYGAAAEGQSFVELFEKLDGVNAIKEAKSGTTLADRFAPAAFIAFGCGDSYVKRLDGIKEETVDCAVIQLSTNDASLKMPLGEISPSKEAAFDTSTVTGAMEYIICSCMERWNCLVVFYTGSWYESEEYSAMTERLYGLQEKWGIGIIDLYNDEAFNSIDPDRYDLYMYDPIHPTKAGYACWWFAKMEKELKQILEGDNGNV